MWLSRGPKTSVRYFSQPTQSILVPSLLIYVLRILICDILSFLGVNWSRNNNRSARDLLALEFEARMMQNLHYCNQRGLEYGCAVGFPWLHPQIEHLSEFVAISPQNYTPLCELLYCARPHPKMLQRPLLDLFKRSFSSQHCQ